MSYLDSIDLHAQMALGRIHAALKRAKNPLLRVAGSDDPVHDEFVKLLTEAHNFGRDEALAALTELRESRATILESVAVLDKFAAPGETLPQTIERMLSEHEALRAGAQAAAFANAYFRAAARVDQLAEKDITSLLAKCQGKPTLREENEAMAKELRESRSTSDDLRAALDRANALIGQETDKAKRLSDEIERLDALVVKFERRIENMTRPCANHPTVRLAPDEGCAICANRT